MIAVVIFVASNGSPCNKKCTRFGCIRKPFFSSNLYLAMILDVQYTHFTASVQYTLDDKKWYWLIMHHQQELKFQGVQFQFCKNPGLSWDILRMGLDPEKYHSFGKVLDSLGDEIYFHSKRGTLHHSYTLKTSHKDVPGTTHCTRSSAKVPQFWYRSQGSPTNPRSHDLCLECGKSWVYGTATPPGNLERTPRFSM